MARKKKPLITSDARPVNARDPKGIQTISVVEAGYNELQLEDVAAQRINERGDEVKAGVMALFKKLSAPPRAPPQPLLKFLTMVELAAMEKFVAKDFFVWNTKKGAGVLISVLSDRFTRCFVEKVEAPKPACTFVVQRLTRRSYDDLTIIHELGGLDNAVSTLSDIAAHMRLQPNGEAGALVTNGCANIFYVCLADGTIASVRVLWTQFGWYVDANSVMRPIEQFTGSRVFSRKLTSM